MNINLQWLAITDATLMLECTISETPTAKAEKYFSQLVAALHFAHDEDISSGRKYWFAGVTTGYIYIERNEKPAEEQQNEIMDFIDKYNKENI